MVRVSTGTSWVVNFALFRCYRPVIYTRTRYRLYRNTFTVSFSAHYCPRPWTVLRFAYENTRTANGLFPIQRQVRPRLQADIVRKWFAVAEMTLEAHNAPLLGTLAGEEWARCLVPKHRLRSRPFGYRASALWALHDLWALHSTRRRPHTYTRRRGPRGVACRGQWRIGARAPVRRQSMPAIYPAAHFISEVDKSRSPRAVLCGAATISGEGVNR